MASVADFRRRICELASAIKVHKDAIGELERTKSEVESDLNAILDPVGRLPLEISSDIFLRCLPSNPTCNKREAPLAFMRVCHSWSNIALSTPSLWTTVSFESPCRKSIVKLCDDWLNRSKALPRSLSISGSLDERAAGLVEQHADRLQNLNLALFSGKELRQLTTMSFVSLTSLTISQGVVASTQRYRVGGDHHYFSTVDECAQMLCAAPNLVECVFDGLTFSRGTLRDYEYPGFSTHPSLKSLRLGTDDLGSSSSAYILQYMTLPALETLSISYPDIPPSDFIGFLTRSSALLRTLSMKVYTFHTMWSVDVVDALFRLLPTLTHLNLQFGGGNLPEFFESLVIRSLSELPNLRDLQVRECAPARPQYERLVGVLAADAKIRSFRLVWTDFPNYTPDPDILVSLQEIAANGVEIHVGPEESNLI
ncbi:hypothetical protein C8F04DRAFT_1111728 [Mycena alexandri]|uniref:F-box domain-containing protein n=1 Tax=Mycena alexandri TaxID=1745969 RepID=A0AAD6SRG1_9AGAR|nr:hypothetical protein C8F04DRAFT_1111728 [Mycena alexandri]